MESIFCSVPDSIQTFHILLAPKKYTKRGLGELFGSHDLVKLTKS